MILGNPLQRGTYTIIGAGISGLLLGYYLKKKNIPFKIFEKSERAGGLMQTVPTLYGRAEAAANGFLWCREIQEIADHIGAEIISPLPAANKKYFVRNKQLQRFPLTVGETVSTLIKVLFSTPPLPITMNDFGNFYFGKTFTQQIVEPAMRGIYAADSTELSFAACLPGISKKISPTSWLPLAALKSFQHRQKIPTQLKGTHSFKGGMQQFIDKLSVFLKEEIIFNTAMNEWKEKNENLVITTPAYLAKNFFLNHPLQNLLSTIHLQPTLI